MNKDMNLREHGVQQSHLSNMDPEAHGGEWWNFLKVKLCGMGGEDERIWCLLHEHMTGLEPRLQFARAFELEPVQSVSTSYPVGRLEYGDYPLNIMHMSSNCIRVALEWLSSGITHPHQLRPLMQQLSGSSWIPMAHAQPCLFSQTNLSPTCSARIF